MNVESSYLLNRFHSGYSAATGMLVPLLNRVPAFHLGLSPWYYYAVSHASDRQSVWKTIELSREEEEEA